MEPFWEAPWGEQPRFNAKPWPCEPEEAQRYLNVPLLWPVARGIPEGMSLGALTVRPEGEKAWSSAHLTLSGGGRRLRLKQFHFDWWRPSEITVGLQRTLGFYRAGDTVVAWGRDQRGRSAAGMAWGRSTVLLRIERGTFAEIELRQLLASLEPAVPTALPVLAVPAFHELSYHIRRGHGPRQLDEIAAADWTEEVRTIRAASPTPLLLPEPIPPGWRFDGGALWPAPPPLETQWLLRDEQGSTVLYARARPTQDPQPLKLPPHYQPTEGWRVRQSLLRRRRMTLAHQHPDLGGWSAAWAEGGYRYQLFVRAGALSGEKAFTRLIEGLKAASK
ncbi:MAG: hypothetical protein H0T73_11200 [Ardenticatenales bacterium]|nr:hypothetical protein [Ardenticatenales bacterium]